MGSVLHNTSISLLEKSLDAVWLRQQVIANNIANAATPGYKSQRLEFEELLESRIGRAGTDDASLQRAMDDIDPQIVRNENSETQEDGNSVDLDRENIEMARAQMQYSYLCNSLNAQINRLKYVVSEGRG